MDALLVCDEQRYSLAECELFNYGVNSGYRCFCALFADDDVTLLIGQVGILILRHEHWQRQWTVVCCQVRYAHNTRDKRYYRCEFASPHVLFQTPSSAVYHEQTITELWRGLFATPKLSLDISHSLDDFRATTIQYQESSWDCWLRFIARNHYCFVFKTDPNRSMHVMATLGPQREHQLLKQRALGLTRSQPAIAACYDYACKEGRVKIIETDCYRLDVLDHMTLGAQDWLVVMCDWRFDASGYRAKLVLVPAQKPSLIHDPYFWQQQLGYCPDWSRQQARATLRECLAATVIGEMQQGRVAIRFDWQSDDAMGVRVPRLSYAPDHVQHRLALGTRVVVGFIEDDIEQPIIIGSLNQLLPEQASSDTICYGQSQLKLDAQQPALELATHVTSLSFNQTGIELNAPRLRVRSNDLRYECYHVRQQLRRQQWFVLHDMYQQAINIEYLGQRLKIAGHQEIHWCFKSYQHHGQDTTLTAKACRIQFESGSVVSRRVAIESQQALKFVGDCLQIVLSHHQLCMNKSVLEIVSKGKIQIHAERLICKQINVN